MKIENIAKTTSNFFAVVLLVSLLSFPFIFAKNVAKVAGVKSESRYLLVSQAEKFPNLTFSQQGTEYQLTFTKQGPSQAFLGVLVLNNPTQTAQTYQIGQISDQGKIFFGEDLENQKTTISLPSSSSVPLSLLSEEASQNENQTTVFTITTN